MSTARVRRLLRGSEVKDAETIERMRIAGRLAAQALPEVGAPIKPGVTTDELDRIGHEYLCDHGAYPSTLGYKGFPKSLCTSINEVICHGIPDDTDLADGDIVNIDITAFIGGVHGDTDATIRPVRLTTNLGCSIERTEQAMLRGINAVAPGRSVNVIGRVIEAYASGSATASCGLHRPRDRHRLSLRSGDPPLRRPGLGHRHRNRHDLHDRAHAYSR